MCSSDLLFCVVTFGVARIRPRPLRSSADSATSSPSAPVTEPSDNPSANVGVATGMSDRGLTHCLATHGLSDRFVTLQTADRHPSKPHPSMLQSALFEAAAQLGAIQAKKEKVRQMAYELRNKGKRSPNADGKMEIRPLSPDMYRVEYEAARKLGLPVSVHLNSTKFDKDHIIALHKLGYVFNGLQVIHAINTSPEEMDILAAAGASVSISPASEMRIGFGLPKIAEFLDRKVNLALSVDTTPLTGNADMFGIMKLAQNLENGRSESEFKLPARKVIELATIEAAKALGLADRTGSLKKGKRADVIMVSTRDVNIGPFTEPAYMLVDSAQAANVDTVLVDGRILKRGGKLTAIDTGKLMTEASAATQAIIQRANWK